MKLRTMLAAATMMLAGPVSATQYGPLANPPDPVAQRDELIALYDEICLKAFPDEAAAIRAVNGYDATQLSPEALRQFLHDDPGIGWELRGRTGRIYVAIERSPPYRSCAVRTMTANGFTDLRPYQALAARYEQGRHFEPITRMDRNVRELHIIGLGERFVGPDGSSESLLVAITSASDEFRARGDTAVEMRFIHQYYTAPVRHDG
jgi:hypothetical protein